MGFELTVKRLKEVFEITITKNPKLVLGVQLDRDFEANTIKLHQSTYIRSFTDLFVKDTMRSRAVPMEPGTSRTIIKSLYDVQSRGEQGHEHELRSRAGKIIYLKTRPDVAFAGGFIARFVASAGEEELKRSDHLMQYLKGRIADGIIYSHDGDNTMTAYSDSDLGGDPCTARTTAGIMIFIGKSLVYYRSFLMRKVTGDGLDGYGVDVCSP